MKAKIKENKGGKKREEIWVPLGDEAYFADNPQPDSLREICHKCPKIAKRKVAIEVQSTCGKPLHHNQAPNKTTIFLLSG